LDESFTPKQIASALRVSESSVKRWCDRGDIRTDRTLGGHRRVPLGFLLEFLESTNRRIVAPDAIGLMQTGHGFKCTFPRKLDLADAISRFTKSLINGEEEDCRRIVSSLYSQGGVVSLADDLLSPAFRAIGEQWENGQIDIFQERRGCEITVRLILELRRLLPDPGGLSPLAMGGTPSGDHYQLPTLLTEMVLREKGWRTMGLGSNLPFCSLLSAARKHMPKIFWISVSHVENEADFLQEWADFNKRLPRGVVVVIGGRALTDKLRPKMVYSAHCDGMQQLATLASTLKSSNPQTGPSN